MTNGCNATKASWLSMELIILLDFLVWFVHFFSTRKRVPGIDFITHKIIIQCIEAAAASSPLLKKSSFRLLEVDPAKLCLRVLEATLQDHRCMHSIHLYIRLWGSMQARASRNARWKTFGILSVTLLLTSSTFFGIA